MSNKGILMPVSSLPSKYGVGDFGVESIRFIDYLKKNNQSYWQILPLNPLGPGWSAYLTASSFAIDFRYVDLEDLQKRGLIKNIECFPHNPSKTLFYEGGEFKKKYLYEAFLTYSKTSMKEMNCFRKKNPWVIEYATFMYFKEKNGEENMWDSWSLKEKRWFIEHKRYPLNGSFRIKYHIFTQWILFSQWKKIMDYAHYNDIKIIGDIPFYVGYDSSDCWCHQSQFDLDKNFHPKSVGGVPPDYFSKTGQLWGNPCYNFSAMKKDHFSFLVNRTLGASKMCDILRLDHFRAFYDYYAIPYGSVDATVGEWKLGPAEAFFDDLYKAKPNIKIIAEDLGDLSPGVLILRDHYNLPGMDVFEFTCFDEKFKHSDRLVVYSGTHDNDTLFGWLTKLNDYEKGQLKSLLNVDDSNLYKALLEHIYSLPSYLTIISMVDILALDSTSRLNVPGTVGSPNFEWRAKEDSY